MIDARMVAVRATATGSDLREATEKVYTRLGLFYGKGNPILLCELHVNPPGSNRPDVVTVTATGFHRPGQMLRCDGSNSRDTLVPYDAPCITKLGMGWVTPEPATPDSVVGMNRGTLVYVLDGDQWVKRVIPQVEHIYDGNAGYFKPDYAPELA